LIRQAEPADAELLAGLAARTFSETFGAENRPEDLALHLATAYGIPQQSAELADPAITTLIAEVEGTPAGYAQIKSAPPPECVPDRSALEIMRFWSGLPLASFARGLFRTDAAVAEARHRGARSLWLGVWERNPRAIAFYAKCGFVTAGEKTFWVGEDRQNDLVMVRPL